MIDVENIFFSGNTFELLFLCTYLIINYISHNKFNNIIKLIKKFASEANYDSTNCSFFSGEYSNELHEGLRLQFVHGYQGGGKEGKVISLTLCHLDRFLIRFISSTSKYIILVVFITLNFG